MKEFYTQKLPKDSWQRYYIYIQQNRSLASLIQARLCRNPVSKVSDSDNSFLCVSRLENPPSTLFSSSIEFSTMELILLYSASIAVCLRESRTSVVQLHYCHYAAAAATLTRYNRGCVMILRRDFVFLQKVEETWKLLRNIFFNFDMFLK